MSATAIDVAQKLCGVKPTKRAPKEKKVRVRIRTEEEKKQNADKTRGSYYRHKQYNKLLFELIEKFLSTEMTKEEFAKEMASMAETDVEVIVPRRKKTT
jgi:hypothetical protein